MPTQFLSEKEEDLFFMKAKGNSMEPDIMDGDLLLFKWDEDMNSIQDNQIILCSLNNELKVKRFKKLKTYGLLISDNKEEYEPIKIDGNDETKMIGKLIKMR